MVLLDGLDDGRWALVCKTHHCLVDGVGSVDLLAAPRLVVADGAPGLISAVEEIWPRADRPRSNGA